jgi:hypothetical protein
MPAVAFGHVIRQQHADVRPPGSTSTSLATATVQPISWSDAKTIITLYEPMPRVSSGLAYGLVINGEIAGAVVFGPDPAANLGVWRRYGCDGEIIALLRGACAPWAPRNAGSKLVRGAMRLLPPQYKVVTAFSDATLGERGVIYKAAGFTAAGVMSKKWRTRRVLIRYRGKMLSERSARRRFGTSSVRRLAKLGFKVETVPRRSRYFAFRGSRSERRQLRLAFSRTITAGSAATTPDGRGTARPVCAVPPAPGTGPKAQKASLVS